MFLCQELFNNCLLVYLCVTYALQKKGFVVTYIMFPIGNSVSHFGLYAYLRCKELTMYLLLE